MIEVEGKVDVGRDVADTEIRHLISELFDTKKGGDCALIPAVREVSNARATYAPTGTST